MLRFAPRPLLPVVLHGPLVESDPGSQPRKKSILLGQPVQLVQCLSVEQSKYAGIRRDGEIVVAIQDNGMGIPLDAQARLFERFYRVPRTNGEKIQGTGLGLAIVKSVIEKHSGRVFVQSEPGEGSIFGFALPINHAGE